MATVTCKYCKKKFNREKEPYVQIPTGASFRYGHSQCYLDAVNNGIEKQHYQIWDPATSTTCFWCHKPIQKTQIDVIPMPQLKDRYIHKACAETHPEDDKEKLSKAALGLTMQEAENAFALAMVNDGKINKDDLSVILEEKVQL